MNGAITTVRLAVPGSEPGAEIEAEIRPGDAPNLVFLHGMTSDRHGAKSDAVDRLARELGLGFARFDFRGHGASDGDFGKVTISDLIADVGTVVSRVGKSILIGSSMGGLAAAWFAAQNPGAIVALALLAPAFGYLPEFARHDGAFELRRVDGGTVTLDARVARDARNYDEQELPLRLEIPVFLAHGSEDQTVPPRLSDDFCRQIPHTQKEIWLLEGGSHSLSEDIDPILARLAVFLATHGVIPVR